MDGSDLFDVALHVGGRWEIPDSALCAADGRPMRVRVVEVEVIGSIVMRVRVVPENFLASPETYWLPARLVVGSYRPVTDESAAAA